MTKSLRAAAVFAAAAILPVVHAQYTGVSHPEQVQAETPASVDHSAPPAGYQPTPPATVQALNQRARPEDGMVIESPPALALQPRSQGLPSGTDRDDNLAAKLERHETTKQTAVPDPDAGIVTEWDGPANMLPPGTLLRARIQEELSTLGTATGTIFHAELTEPVERDGRVLLPPGAMISGRVTEVHGGRRISGAASLHLQPEEVTMPDGERYRIVGQVVDTNIYHQVKVDSEGTIVRRDHAGKTIAEIGLATGAGAAAGGVLGGVPGAFIGGAVGAGVGTAVWLKQDRQTQIPAGTGVIFSLNEALQVGQP